MRDALMPKLVDLLHESGMFVVAEGIETSEDLMLAARSNVDFVQGYLFGMPSAELAERGAATPLFEDVFDTLAQTRRTERLAGDLLLLPYRAALTQAARRFASGATTEAACADLLALPCTLSCFFLDQGGREFMPGLRGRGRESAERALRADRGSFDRALGQSPVFRRCAREAAAGDHERAVSLGDGHVACA